MSRTLEIPKDDREQINKWLVEGEDPADKIIDALKAAKPALRRTDLSRAITRAIGGDRAIVDRVLRLLFRVLQTVRMKGDPEETIQALYQAVVGTATSDADKLKRFQGRVKDLISIPSLVVTAKALGVLAANANTFCRARTVSEVRPVFTEDALTPQAAVIVHQLNIVFHSGPKMEEDQFFVTLDADDLEDLKRVIDRALDKNKEIVGLMQDRVQLLTENPE